jgi:hypothetical protein
MARIWFVFGFPHPTCALIVHRSLLSGRPSAATSVLSHPRSIPFSDMSTNPPPELTLLFEAALNEFEKRAGSNLVQHQVIQKLQSCESADSVIDVLQDQAQAFRNFRGDDGRLMKWFKRTVNVLYTLSTSDVLSEGISLVCDYSLSSHAPRNIISLAFSSGKGDLRWTRYTSWRMFPTCVQSRGLFSHLCPPSVDQRY